MHTSEQVLKSAVHGSSVLLCACIAMIRPTECLASGLSFTQRVLDLSQLCLAATCMASAHHTAEVLLQKRTGSAYRLNYGHTRSIPLLLFYKLQAIKAGKTPSRIICASELGNVLHAIALFVVQ